MQTFMKKIFMLNRLVAGHLSEKKGYYYAVISFNDNQGKRKTKWYSTGLPVKGNKKKAEAMLTDIRCNFKIFTNHSF